METQWLFVLRYYQDGAHHDVNCFYSEFPSKSDLLKATGGQPYTIIHIHELTDEQYEKLTLI